MPDMNLEKLAYDRAIKIATEFYDWFELEYKKRRGRPGGCDRFFEGASYAAQHIKSKLETQRARLEKGQCLSPPMPTEQS